MPTYVYRCPAGHDAELRRPADNRDDPATCACGQALKRLITMPMAVVWQGRFHDPSMQKKDTDGLGPSW